jgi:uncharacterized protein YkwD
MLAIPALAYSLATMKITESVTNIWLYIFIQFGLYAIISAIVLFVSEKIVSGIENLFFRRSRYPFRYFQPQVIYVVIGLVIVSVIGINLGNSILFSENSNRIIGSVPTSNVGSSSPSSQIKFETNTPSQIVTPEILNLIPSNKFTSQGDSEKAIDYVNKLRVKNRVPLLRFDSRVYNIAMARVNDMDNYGYMDHTNPQTGSCPDSIKTQYGLSDSEYVAENAFGFDTGGHYSTGLENEAIDSWMTSRGHRYNLLYPHLAGAVACSRGGHCVFLGLNNDRFGAGCHTGAEGMAYWNSAGKQPGEFLF